VAAGPLPVVGVAAAMLGSHILRQAVGAST
jgi:hypothetical protein